MAGRRDGAIIIISSIGAIRGSGSLGVYNITKAADIQLARNLAIEFGPHNVRTNCIAPGLIKTDFSKTLWDNPDNLDSALRALPLGRIGEADDIAGAAVFWPLPPANTSMAKQSSSTADLRFPPAEFRTVQALP